MKSITIDCKPFAILFVEKQHVKHEVTCDIYNFEKDSTRDIAIVTVLPGCKTPPQRVMEGIKTIEGLMLGVGTLTVDNEIHYLEEGEANDGIEVEVGQTMQWEAGLKSDLVFYEICEPPYKKGRFKDIEE